MGRDKDRVAFGHTGGGSGITSDEALPAGPTGWTLVAATDLEAGGIARLMEIPLSMDAGFVTIFQDRFEGDTFPRLVIVSDGSYYFSDGTFNPLQGQPQGLIPSGDGLRLSARTGASLVYDPITGAIHLDSPDDIHMGAGGRFIINGVLGVAISTLSSSPPDSHTATVAFGALAVGTPLLNSLGYDVLVSGTITITSATAGSLKLGVDSAAAPTTDPITGSITTATAIIISFSAHLPDGYYLSLQSAGTIALSAPTIVVTPI